MHIYCYWFATRRQRIIRKESCVWTTSAHPLTGSFRSGSPSVRPHLSAGSAAGQKLLQCLLKAFLLTEELRISRYTIRSVENGWGLHKPDSTTVVVCLQHQWTKQQLLHGKVTEWLYSVVRCVVFGVFKLYHTSLYVSLTLQRVRGWSARCQCAVNNECGSPGSRARHENVHPCCCIRNWQCCEVHTESCHRKHVNTSCCGQRHSPRAVAPRAQPWCATRFSWVLQSHHVVTRKSLDEIRTKHLHGDQLGQLPVPLHELGMAYFAMWSWPGQFR